MKITGYLWLLNMTLVINAHEMVVVGHRGACGYKPENTLSSFRQALHLDVKMIEVDVFVCATGELIVIHDETVDRTTNGHGYVVDMTFDQLRCLVVEGKEKIPTLEEVVDLLNRKVPLNIELKGPGTAILVAQLLKKYLARGWTSDNFIVSSFDLEQLNVFHQMLPTIAIGVLLNGTIVGKIGAKLSAYFSSYIMNFLFGNSYRQIVKLAQQSHAMFVGVDVNDVTTEMIQVAHQAGMLVFVWTVNDKKTADNLRSMLVDGIFSNYPDKV